MWAYLIYIKKQTKQKKKHSWQQCRRNLHSSILGGEFCFRLCGYQSGLWGCRGANERLGNRGEKHTHTHWDKWEGEREVFWPLVAFVTQAQIIEGHGNWSDRWTMLPFSSPLWTGPSITAGEINSIHQCFVSMGPLMPPDIAQRGLINVCGFDVSFAAWHRIKTLLFTRSSTQFLPTACHPPLP